MIIIMKVIRNNDNYYKNHVNHNDETVNLDSDTFLVRAQAVRK